MEMLGQLKVTDGANCAPPMRFERCFVEVRRRTRPMVLFVNMAAWRESSMRFFTASISSGKTAPSLFLHKQLDATQTHSGTNPPLLTV